VVNLNILEIINIFKLIEYLAALLYNIMLKVREYTSLAHRTSRDDIGVKTRDIVDILN
jgi:uncharacterized membrane protein